jgi:thymidylate synthase
MDLSLYARSIDIFLGLPYNIASYALLLKMLCAVTGYEAGDLIISFGNLHLYNNHVEQAKLQLSREPRPLPQVDIQVPDGNSPLERLLAIRWGNVSLTGYNPHPKIEAEVAV